MLYFRCDGPVTVSPVDPTAIQCSTGWLEAPAIPLVSREQSDELMMAMMAFVIAIFVFRELARLVR